MYRCTPSHLIATWITPCGSRKVQVSSTSNRRHTIGLIPSSQTLTCTTPTASGTGGAGSASALAFDCFEGLGTSQTYRARPYAVAGTTHFLLVSDNAQQLHVDHSDSPDDSVGAVGQTRVISQRELWPSPGQISMQLNMPC